MPVIATLTDLYRNNYTLGLYCIACNRWGEADLKALIADGRGEREVTQSRFRCIDCGEIVEKQIRPPVPSIGNAVAYIC
jgi:hypothetical protein